MGLAQTDTGIIEINMSEIVLNHMEKHSLWASFTPKLSRFAVLILQLVFAVHQICVAK
jgi:hypothetical protein